jgi:hypothetical protein
MENRYVGDLGDFGKYGLLRALCSGGNRLQIKLGVVWYLVPCEAHNKDGKHVNYLRNANKTSTKRLRNCDSELYDGLRELLINDRNEIVSERRLVKTIESSGLLPSGTVFYNDPLSFSRQMSISDRLKERRAWLEGALQATPLVDLVFLDPDNGIECKSVSRTDLKGPKYVYWDEIRSFADREQSIVVYHHLNRSCPSTEQVELLRSEFCKRMPANCETSKIIYRRGTRRAYFIVMTPRFREDITNKLSKMPTQWENHFVE